jgi:hypothetical protein
LGEGARKVQDTLNCGRGTFRAVLPGLLEGQQVGEKTEKACEGRLAQRWRLSFSLSKGEMMECKLNLSSVGSMPFCPPLASRPSLANITDDSNFPEQGLKQTGSQRPGDEYGSVEFIGMMQIPSRIKVSLYPRGELVILDPPCLARRLPPFL